MVSNPSFFGGTSSGMLLRFANPATGTYFHFIAGQQAGIDMEFQLHWTRGTLLESDDLGGSWTEATDAFSLNLGSSLKSGIDLMRREHGVC